MSIGSSAARRATAAVDVGSGGGGVIAEHGAHHRVVDGAGELIVLGGAGQDRQNGAGAGGVDEVDGPLLGTREQAGGGDPVHAGPEDVEPGGRDR